MTLFDCLAVLALVFSFAAYFQTKIARLWDAIVELDSRKLDIEAMTADTPKEMNKGALRR